MGQLVINISPKKHYPQNKDIRQLLTYVAGHSKTKKFKAAYSNGYGVSADYKKAYQQIIKVQKYYKKDSKRRMYHMVISFPSQYKCDLPCTIKIAKVIAKIIFKDYQIFYGIHTDTNNLHIHFAINAVNYRTGKKFHTSKADLAQMRADILNLVNKIHRKYSRPYQHEDLTL